jgi:hypothetical protein
MPDQNSVPASHYFQQQNLLHQPGAQSMALGCWAQQSAADCKAVYRSFELAYKAMVEEGLRKQEAKLWAESWVLQIQGCVSGPDPRT